RSHRHPPSFPTRRSSDLATVLSIAGQLHASYSSSWVLWWFGDGAGILMVAPFLLVAINYLRGRRLPARERVVEAVALLAALVGVDRKSTRLNSSHVSISY